MTLPIGSGFFTGDIPGRVNSAKAITPKPQGLVQDNTSQKTNADYVKTSEEALNLANQYFTQNTKSAQYSQTIYDQPSPTVSKAISTYTEFANLERRAEVQDLIGVDIYA